MLRLPTRFATVILSFAPSGPVVLGIDDTIERRRGSRIAAKGIYRWLPRPVTRSPASPACASTRRSTTRHRPGCPEPTAAPAPRAPGCRTCPWC